MLLKKLPLKTLVLTGLLSWPVVPLWAQTRQAVILHTNDFHSALDPIPAYWLPGTPSPDYARSGELGSDLEQKKSRTSLV